MSSILALSAFIVILVASLWVRVSFVRESLPYCRHVDEKTWTEIAIRIARDGDLNPHRFNKPSVMVYLTTAGLALGLIRAGSRGEAHGPKDLGTRAYPYYEQATAIQTPKTLVTAGSVAALAMAGVCAWLLLGNQWLLALTAFLAALSSSYFWHSWEYINADIIGAFFIFATLTHLLFEHRNRPEFVRTLGFALLHGILAGLTIGSKYNLFPIALPYLLYTWLFPSERQIARSIGFLVALGVGFVISTPYALFALNEFLEGAVREARHYATSHRGRYTEAGLPMLGSYLWDLRQSFGIPVLLVAFGGVFAVCTRNLRLALVTFSFPLAFLVYMSSQRVFFARNIVALHLFVALAAAIGLVEGFALVGRLLEKRPRLASLSPPKRRAVLYAPFVLFALCLPWRSAFAMYTQDVESRNEAQRVILDKVSPGKEIFVEDDLFMDTRLFATRYKVTPFEDRPATLKRFLGSPKGSALIAVQHDDNLVKQAQGRGAEVLLRAGASVVNPLQGSQDGNPKLVVLRR